MWGEGGTSSRKLLGVDDFSRKLEASCTLDASFDDGESPSANHKDMLSLSRVWIKAGEATEALLTFQARLSARSYH